MTDHQINIMINTYFNTLIERGISEKHVKDMYQKDGILFIVLNNEKIIEEKIKNFNS